MSGRGWTRELISEAVERGQMFPATNMITRASAAIRYVHPTTGQSVVLDSITNEVLHVGGPGFLY